MPVRTYTITEAADLTGLSRKAIARRVERGSLRSVVRNGRRRIPRSELVRAGLLGEDGEQPRASDPDAPVIPRPSPGGALAETGSSEEMLAALFREVLDRFERQSQEIAQYRALTVQAESLRLTNELAELRVRLAELERQPQEPVAASQAAQQAAQHAAATDLGRRVSELTKQVEELSNREIWLPPQAATAPPANPGGAVPMPPIQPRPAAPVQPVRQPAQPRIFHFSRTKRFALEVAFIVAVAVVVWQAKLPTPAIAVAMALAWTLVAVVEWVSSERAPRA
ncbi:MAG TPA: helix-turn-helix domain-containing protein [Gaiellaceae bacterium]|nr:helix-turn-helix domain-containing protein [Gaiellaceae bacterium]